MTSCFLAFASQSGDYVVIANPSFQSSQMSENELKNIFNGQILYSKTGVRVLPAYLSNESVAFNDFAAEVLKMPVQTYVDQWRRMLFSGKAYPPRTFDTDEELSRYVESEPGAIAPITTSSFDSRKKYIKIKIEN